MTEFATLKDAFRIQAEFCRSSGSPFAALVLEAIAARLEPGSVFTPFLAPWIGAKPGRLFADAVSLRLMGAFHFLALGGSEPELTALYPPHPAPEPELLGSELHAAAERHGELILGYMASPPQTNEVGRSLCLVGGFLTAAKETGLPLRCLELGASAGLNMNWDRYRYRFGDGAAWGRSDSPLQLEGAWTGPPPPTPPRVEVVERAACDQNPIDVAGDESALRLQSYVWADQSQRLERLRAAIALKRQTGGPPDRADAAEWTARHLHPREGVATVVYHSSFIYYPPRETQDRIKSVIAAAGARASATAPLFWLSKEPPPDNMAGPDELRLRSWPDGRDRLLARAHAHGAWVEWLA